MLFFRNDYGQGCIPEILDLLQQTKDESITGYGLDHYTNRAVELIKSKMQDADVDIHFISGGTLTNKVMIKHALKPYEAVIACDSGHISIHETGAIEATGHKVIELPNSNGKLLPNAIRKCFEQHMLTYEHLVYPKLVYISNATELGTVYTRDELIALRKVCDELDLYLMMDGARLGQALMSGIDYSLNDIARWCDIFYIGGTKNGAFLGEAVVISNPELKKNFRFNLKQTGAMLAKGWLFGLQFIGLFENDAFYKNGAHANNCAKRIQSTLQELKYPLLMKSDTNQVFPVVTFEQYEFFKDKVDFEVWEKREDSMVIRFVTSWHTTEQEVDELIELLKTASKL